MREWFVLHETTAHVHHILSRQLQQHWLVEELVQCDVIGQTLNGFLLITLKLLIIQTENIDMICRAENSL